MDLWYPCSATGPVPSTTDSHRVHGGGIDRGPLGIEHLAYCGIAGVRWLENGRTTREPHRLKWTAAPQGVERCLGGAMSRSLRPTRNPDAVAFGIMALRSFAAGTESRNRFVTEVGNALSNMGVTRADARRLIANFDRTSPIIRRRVFGPRGFADAKLPARIPRIQPRDVESVPVFLPGALRRLGRFRPGEPIDLDPQVLAPERYTIRYKGMHCIDETHADWLGSDEAYIITSAVHITREGENEVLTVRHPFEEGEAGVYGDVDSGETRVGPVASSWSALVANITGGMSLTTTVMEHDQGDPDEYRDEIDAAVKLAIGVAIYFCPACSPILLLVEASGFVTDFFNWLLGTGDDIIGTSTVVLELPDLEEYSRTRPGDYFRNGKETGLIHQFIASVNDNDYVAAFEVMREPFAPYFEPIVE